MLSEQKIELRERCKAVHCVDLGESFPTHILLQNLASIQPRTSPFKFARSPRTDPPGANWDGFGTTYAFIHMGLVVQRNGTTVAMSKLGSGLNDALNPCIQTVLQTKEYQQLCQAGGHPVDMKCFTNEFFSDEDVVRSIYATSQSKRTDTKTCADGYCTCSEEPSS